MNICNLIRHIQQKQHLHQVIDKVLTIYVWNRRYFESHSGTQTHTQTLTKSANGNGKAKRVNSAANRAKWQSIKNDVDVSEANQSH